MPIVRTHEPIATWQDGDFAQGFALVSRKEKRQDRRGKNYIDLQLTDASGSIEAKIWPDSPALKGRFADKDFIYFKGTVKRFKDSMQLSIDHCRQIEEADRQRGFDEALLTPSTPEDIDDLQHRLQAIYPGQIGRPELQALANEALRRYGKQLRGHAAAKSIHHAYYGGLLEHVVKMAEVAIDLCRHYPEIDRDLLLVGVLFHDLGKLLELGAMPHNDYTLEGQLVGHIAMGHRMLDTCCAALDAPLAVHLRLHLEHRVLSHHGRREYGSPIEPATVEAMALNWIDTLDSRLNQIRNFRRMEGDGVHFLRSMGRSVVFDARLVESPSDRGSEPAD